MKKNYLILLILCIWNSILLFNKTFGLNIIMFVLPLLVFLVYILVSNKKVINKKGLLFLIPIGLLSCSYFILDNSFTSIVNVPVISLLFVFMYMFTMKPTYNLNDILNDIVYLFVLPFSQIGKVFSTIFKGMGDSCHLKDGTKNKIKSFFIILPIVIIVLVLLSSADMMFGNIFKDFTNIFKNIKISEIISRIITISILFIYTSATVSYLVYEYVDKPRYTAAPKKYNTYTIKLLLTVLNIIYVVFDFIQIRSLMLHQVSSGINYSEYARTGFFQLMIISVINLVILLISKKCKEDTKYVKGMSLGMIILTLVIIASSFMRMNLYEAAYGYTLLRLLVYVTLITEVILLIPTIIYIFSNKFNIFKSYMIIIVIVYTIVGLTPIDYIIARRNVDRYYNNKEIDLDYLFNGSSDNVDVLIELSNKTKDKDMKKDISKYLKNHKKHIKSNDIREYNISKKRSYKLISEMK